jgi:tetratricopeptide (TPR) repeat protein
LVELKYVTLDPGIAFDVRGGGLRAAVSSADAPADAQPEQPKTSRPELRSRQQKAAPTTGKEEIPPEEDKQLSTEEFSFNPLEAEKWLSVGNYYFKQGKYRSAADRYKGATKWNDGLGPAWLRLGEAEEKLKDPQAAKDAYTKYLEVAPEAKNAEVIRKKLEKLK